MQTKTEYGTKREQAEKAGRNTPGQAPGLTPEQVEGSRKKHGENVLPEGKRKSFLSRFFENLGDPVIKILLGALAVNGILLFRGGDVAETVGIGISVLIATMISTLSEYGSDKAFSRLKETGDRGRCRVRRAGGISEIPVRDVVVGDRVILGPGDDVPADGIVVSGAVGLDMSAMTGENREVIKRPSRDRSCEPGSPSSALRGSFVTSGQGEMEVTAVGAGTFLGGISREVQTETRPSPLKIRLTELARQISRMGYFAAAAIATAYLFNAIVLDSGGNTALMLMKIRDLRYMFSCFTEALTLALTVIVVAVPEGLPMMIAVVLSSNVKRMVRAGVLVKKPVGIEAAGSMNVLFTDKTGTLTEGKMTVTSVITGGEGGAENAARIEDFLKKGGGGAEAYRLSCLYNSSSFPGSREDTGSDRPDKKRKSGNDNTYNNNEGKTKKKRVAVGGNATDRALMDSVLAGYGGMSEAAEKAEVTGRIPFDSVKKYSAVSLRLTGGDRGGEEFSLYKGAPELLLPHIFSRDGGYFDRYSVGNRISSACREGARAVVIAKRKGRLPVGDGLPDDLEFVCAVLLRDPPRKTAAPAVRSLRRAGIHVVMVTGDGADTASAIARECGIIGSGVDLTVTGSELDKMTDSELAAILPRIAVVARALPSDKSRLVRISGEAGLVTGMTGDGINDAPALRAADVGFAMGSGTEVAKDAGDIVILDNDAKSIANSVLFGRNVFKSIRKFITLQLTMNLCAVGVSMIGPFIGVDAPVTVVQMLWINIIMDTLGGLAFAGEPALPSCMEEKPKKRDEKILNGYMAGQIACLGLFTVGLSLLFLKAPGFVSRFRPGDNDVCHLTGFFAFFIFAGVFNCFNARTDRMRLFANISKNPAFIAIMCAVLAIQIGFVYLGGSLLRTVPLTAGELAFSMLASLTVFPVDLARKLFLRLRGKASGF